LQTINAIEVSNLSFSYEEQKVLQEINFTIKKNEFTTLIGPNGGGKSTLLKLILGINDIQKGTIKIFGEPYQSQTKKLGYVPQNTNINLSFPITVLEVVMMGQEKLSKRVFGYKKEEKERAVEVLQKVNMQNFANNPISKLSGGQRQRVLIARALFSSPDILLLDEPTSNIDIKGSEQVYKTLQELNQEITVVVVSHDISVILQYASKAIYINKKLTHHDLSLMKNQFKSVDSHICEIELLEMLGRCKC
jgi:zinc transport system ATP-binding protein